MTLLNPAECPQPIVDRLEPADRVFMQGYGILCVGAARKAGFVTKSDAVPDYVRWVCPQGGPCRAAQAESDGTGGVLAPV